MTKKLTQKYFLKFLLLFPFFYYSFIINNSYNRIFLCTLYNNEAEMIYIHIWRLYDYIDKFIVVTSNISHSGQPKNISLKPFEQNIKHFLDKVDIVNFNNICNRKEYPEDDDLWCIEKSQRDYAKTFIEEYYNPTEKDLLIVVDMDEILTKEGIKYIKKIHLIILNLYKALIIFHIIIIKFMIGIKDI